MDVWTIGHGTRPLAEFLAVLQAARIQRLADVRAFPGSRRHPQFGAAALAAALAGVGITYVHLRGLGGRRTPRADSPHRALRVAAFRAYADHMSTEEFASDYGRLRALAADSPTVFMCAETLWWRCHRRFIADRLTIDGATVVHLLDIGRSEPHVLNEAVRIEDGNLVYDAGTLALRG